MLAITVAGTVTDEILTAVDWLPTLSSLVGEPNRVPDDRPIDGVDASAFLLGHSPTSGPIIKPQWPLVFGLLDHSSEEWDLMDKRLDCIWVLGPVARRLGGADAERGPLPQHQARPGLHRILLNSGGHESS